MTRPRISCVIPTYESPGLAERCIRAAAAQTGVETEIIVSDDSASSAVRDVAARLAAEYPHIAYGPGARTGNPVDNWNSGLDRARGDYAVVVHHDELLIDPDYLRRAVEALDRGGARALVGWVSPEGMGASRYPKVSAWAHRLRLPAWTLYLVNWIGPTATVVFPLTPAARFDRRLVWNSDVDFYARLFSRYGEIARDSAPGVATVAHVAQITARIDPRKMGLQELRMLAREEPGRMAAWKYRLLLGFAALRFVLSRR